MLKYVLFEVFVAF